MRNSENQANITLQD